MSNRITCLYLLVDHYTYDYLCFRGSAEGLKKRRGARWGNQSVHSSRIQNTTGLVLLLDNDVQKAVQLLQSREFCAAFLPTAASKAVQLCRAIRIHRLKVRAQLIALGRIEEET